MTEAFGIADVRLGTRDQSCCQLCQSRSGDGNGSGRGTGSVWPGGMLRVLPAQRYNGLFMEVEDSLHFCNQGRY